MKRKPWRWKKLAGLEPEIWRLIDGRGDIRGTIWSNGTWHSWEPDGTGAENGKCETVQDAKDQLVAAVVRQEWTPFQII